MIAKAQQEGRAGGSRAVKALVGKDDLACIEQGFREALPLQADLQWHLRGVVHDALTHPGSLARAQITFSLMTAMGFDRAVSRDAGIAVEYFHTASLLFDDLPCMDHATERRGHTCPHVVYGESSAILGALALINQGYALLWRVLGMLPEGPRQSAAALVGECLGLHGILNGQAHDLHFGESDRGCDDVLKIARGKTVTLIRLTLLLPAHMKGMDPAGLKLMERLAETWGLGYQVLDDFKDLLMAEDETGKTTNRDLQLIHPNLPAVMGARPAMEALDGFLSESRAIVGQMRRHLADTRVLERMQALLECDRGRVVALLEHHATASA